MKKILVVFVCLSVLGPAAQAGLVKGAAKGMGKAAKSVGGCMDRGAKGTMKGAKTVVGVPGKVVKSL